ncbi:DUF2786 domain-containing protein [Jiangella sp. DSM 45060]|uniref:DUF2786 domain-containing protein n=1 Tax=Jiangella sp. DSM 45060 TaxID=1798224 RepID=UPI00087A0898|nr:DUF2786 domain-containing protein [Jiangella sp. DSM 45060]SDT70314.1 Protein of unknown function [Jiangella sp. DSM 45060]
MFSHDGARRRPVTADAQADWLLTIAADGLRRGPDAVAAGVEAVSAAAPARLVDVALVQVLRAQVDRLWASGWLPVDLYEVTRRQATSLVLPVVVDAMADAAAQYPVATTHQRWLTQLASVGAELSWDPGVPYPASWPDRHGSSRPELVAAALEWVGLALRLPALQVILPPPGRATAAAPAAGHSARDGAASSSGGPGDWSAGGGDAPCSARADGDTGGPGSGSAGRSTGAASGAAGRGGGGAGVGGRSGSGHGGSSGSDDAGSGSGSGHGDSSGPGGAGDAAGGGHGGSSGPGGVGGGSGSGHGGSTGPGGAGVGGRSGSGHGGSSGSDDAGSGSGSGHGDSSGPGGAGDAAGGGHGGSSGPGGVGGGSGSGHGGSTGPGGAGVGGRSGSGHGGSSGPGGAGSGSGSGHGDSTGPGGAGDRTARRRRPSPEKVLGRVRALLAKAESTPYPEEAEALSAKAQELMSRYAIEEALADAVTPERRTAVASARRIWLDAPYLGPKTLLVAEVGSANHCRTVSSEKLGFVTVLGTGLDLDVVEVLSTSLLVQAARAMLATGSQYTHLGTSRTRSFRHSFLLSYATRIGERLRDTAAQTAAAASTDLVPVFADRTRAVDTLFESLFSTATVRRSFSAGNAAGWGAGRSAADRAVLTTERRAVRRRGQT